MQNLLNPPPSQPKILPTVSNTSSPQPRLENLDSTLMTQFFNELDWPVARVSQVSLVHGGYASQQVPLISSVRHPSK